MKVIRKAMLAIAALVIVIDIAGALYLQHVALDNPVHHVDSKGTLRHLAHRGPFMAPWLDSIAGGQLLRDTFITGHDGARLHAYYLPAPHPTPRTAVLVHGYKTQALDMLHIGYLYHHEMGFNILLPDLHAHGLSEGTHIRMGWKDRLDIGLWIDVANDVFGGNTWMVVHGISMGAATTMMLAGEETPCCVQAFVEDCGYTSVWDEFRGELHNRYGLPPFPLLHTSSLLTQLRFGWNFTEASALHQVERCTRPMLFIHGDSDDFVPTWMAKPLYEAHRGTKVIWLAPDVAHADAFWIYPEEYTRRVKDFLDACGSGM